MLSYRERRRIEQGEAIRAEHAAPERRVRWIEIAAAVASTLAALLAAVAAFQSVRIGQQSIDVARQSMEVALQQERAAYVSQLYVKQIEAIVALSSDMHILIWSATSIERNDYPDYKSIVADAAVVRADAFRVRQIVPIGFADTLIEELLTYATEIPMRIAFFRFEPENRSNNEALRALQNKLFLLDSTVSRLADEMQKYLSVGCNLPRKLGDCAAADALERP